MRRARRRRSGVWRDVQTDDARSRPGRRVLGHESAKGLRLRRRSRGMHPSRPRRNLSRHSERFEQKLSSRPFPRRADRQERPVSFHYSECRIPARLFRIGPAAVTRAWAARSRLRKGCSHAAMAELGPRSSNARLALAPFQFALFRCVAVSRAIEWVRILLEARVLICKIPWGMVVTGRVMGLVDKSYSLLSQHQNWRRIG